MSEGFDLDEFIESFPALVEAEGAGSKLRRLLLLAARTGKLSGGEFSLSEWQTVPLAQCTDVLDAKRVPVNEDEREKRNAGKAEGELFPYYGATRQQGVIAGYLFDETLVLLGEDGVPFLDPDRHKAYVVAGKCWVNNHAHALRPTGVHPKWLCHVLNTTDYVGRITGTTRAKLTQGKMLDIPVPLPPLAEQHRIVAKVDELMRLIDDLEAKQAKKRDVQVRLRTSALDALTRADGPEELAAAWKRVAGNFEVLFERAEGVAGLRDALLRLAVTGALSPQHGTRQSYRQVPLGDVVESRLGKMLDKAKNKGVPLPYLRNTNVHWFSIRVDDIKLMPFEETEVAEFELRDGDVMVCEGGHGIGRSAVWRGQVTPMMFQKALHRLRPSSTLNSDFLCFQIKVAADSGRLEGLYTGMGIPHLTGRSLARLEVAVPPLAEQRRIVAKVEALMKLCDDLEARLKAKEATAKRLVEAVVAELVA